MDNLIYDIDINKVPRHIAIIMDGNGRWAKARFMPRTYGHKMGVEAIRKIVQECSRLGVKYLTLYAFSTENWKRPKDEVSALMKLLVTYLKKELAELNKNNVRLMTIGNIEDLPVECVKELESSMDETSENTGLTLCLALNYGGRNDIKKAVKNIVKDVKCGKLEIESIDEGLISQYLNTKSIPDPDLVVRTSGEQRLSNFLLWEVAYSEFYYTNQHWPDFNIESLQKAIYSYQKRDRRFGGIKK